MKAIIFGITGQDGSYLAELLHDKNYEVVGVTRRVSVDSLQRISHILPQITIPFAPLKANNFAVSAPTPWVDPVIIIILFLN